MPLRIAGQATVVLGRAAVVGAALCLAAVVSVPPAHAAGPWESYAFDAGGRSVAGSTDTGNATALVPGSTYRSSLPADGKVYYRLDLDASSNVYVSVTAVPGSGTTVSATDGIKVSVQDADSRSCSIDTASVGTDRRPHPLTALGARDTSRAGSRCQDAGAYYVLVERVHRPGSSSDAWGLELATASEPALKQGGETSAPQVWNSAPPAPVTGEATTRRGASGFAGAAVVEQGVWRDDMTPGETLFYAVPVDWGQQLYTTAELGSSSGDDDGLVARALVVSLYNPVRGFVDDASVVYDGNQRAAELKPLPPVGYPNRYAVADRVSGMRFAGSYYLAVHLSEQVADRFGEGPFDLTLRVRVTGTSTAGPGYAGEPEPRGVFDATARGRQTAAAQGRASADDDTAMRLLAAGGIGTGTALLLGLGVWTVLGRRSAGVS